MDLSTKTFRKTTVIKRYLQMGIVACSAVIAIELYLAFQILPAGFTMVDLLLFPLSTLWAC